MPKDKDELEEIEDLTDCDTEEVEVLEFALDDEEIDDLIEELNKLKQTKMHFHFNIDEENELLIHHDEDELK